MKTYIISPEYKSLVRHLNHLIEVHQYDIDVLKGIDVIFKSISNDESAFQTVNKFFETERDLLGEHSQNDRQAFFKMCKKLKDENPDAPELEQSIETPQRTHIRNENSDDGIVLERTFHLFSGRSQEQEEHERDQEIKREQELEKQRQQNDQVTQELNRINHQNHINFVGPFNDVAELEKHRKKLELNKKYRQTAREIIRSQAERAKHSRSGPSLDM